MSGIFGMTRVSSFIERRIFEASTFAIFLFGKKYWKDRVIVSTYKRISAILFIKNG